MERYAYLEKGILKADPDTFNEVVKIVDEFYGLPNTEGARWKLENKLTDFFLDLYYQDVADEKYRPLITLAEKGTKIDIKFVICDDD